MTEIDNVLRDNLTQIVLDTCPEEHLSHSEGLVALLYLCVAIFKESDLDLMPMEIVVSSDIPMGAGKNLWIKGLLLRVQHCEKKSI